MHCPPDYAVVDVTAGIQSSQLGLEHRVMPQQQNPSIALAKTLREHDCLILPGAYDAFSAKLVQESGFDAAMSAAMPRRRLALDCPTLVR